MKTGQGTTGWEMSKARRNLSAARHRVIFVCGGRSKQLCVGSSRERRLGAATDETSHPRVERFTPVRGFGAMVPGTSRSPARQRTDRARDRKVSRERHETLPAVMDERDDRHQISSATAASARVSMYGANHCREIWGAGCRSNFPGDRCDVRGRDDVNQIWERTWADGM